MPSERMLRQQLADDDLDEEEIEAVIGELADAWYDRRVDEQLEKKYERNQENPGI